MFKRLEWRSEHSLLELHRTRQKSLPEVYMHSLSCFQKLWIRHANKEWSDITSDYLFSNRSTSPIVVYDASDAIRFPLEDRIIEEGFENELSILERQRIVGFANTPVMKIRCIFASRPDVHMPIRLQLYGCVVLCDAEQSIQRFAHPVNWVCEEKNIPHCRGLFLEGLCRLPHQDTKGVGRHLVSLCKQMAENSRKKLYLSVFNFEADSQIRTSHRRLVDYYSQLGFELLTTFRHAASRSVAYTLMVCQSHLYR